jgi:hypothetical protein
MYFDHQAERGHESVDIAPVIGLNGPPEALDVFPRHRLLRQPGGFEGILAPRKGLQARNLPIPERPHVSGLSLDHGAGPLRLSADGDEGHHLIVTLKELLRLGLERLKSCEAVFGEPLASSGPR